MRPNTVKDQELYVRCPYCGDSQNPNHAHMTINLKTGLYHCLRCNIGGKVTQTLLFNLQIQDFPSLDYNTSRPIPEVMRGPGTQRKSLLTRYHTDQGEDVFYSWWNDAHVGYYLRSRSSKKLWGFSGINWPGAPREILSSPDDPLRFVEGPYDVLTPRDVCFFGIPSYPKVREFFREHFFVLCPDGDLWTDQWRFTILKNLIDRLIREGYGLQGVEFLPSNQDPDSGIQAKFIPVQFFKEKLWQSQSLTSHAKQILAQVGRI